MGLLSNPWLIVVALVAFGAIVGGASWKAYHMGQDSVYASIAKEEKARKEALDLLVAESAGKIVTIHQANQPKIQKVQREIIHDRVYVDCKSDPSVMYDFNSLVGGTAPDAARDSDVHKTDPDH